MIILFRDKRIKSYDRGFMVQKKVGKQWKDAVYPSSLDSAALLLLDELVRDDPVEIDLDSQEAQEKLESFISRISVAKNDIIREVHRYHA